MGSKEGSALSLSLLVLDPKYSSLASVSWNSLEEVTASSGWASRWYLWKGSNRWLGRYGGKP